MELKPKLGHFFLLVIAFVALIVGVIAYGARTNTPGNVVIDGVDIYAPYYETYEVEEEEVHGHHDSKHEDGKHKDGHEENAGHGNEGHH